MMEQSNIPFILGKLSDYNTFCGCPKNLGKLRQPKNITYPCVHLLEAVIYVIIDIIYRAPRWPSGKLTVINTCKDLMIVKSCSLSCCQMRENLSSRFLTKSDTNQAVQTQKMARGLKMQI